MFNNMKIGKRLALAFGVSIILVAVAGLTGFWGLSQAVETTYGILHHDAKLMQEASEAQVNGLELRRYEKDTFLNIGDQQKSADYSEKWKKERAELDTHLNTLEAVTTLPADKEVVRAIRADLSTYTIGFQSVLQQMSGTEAIFSNTSGLPRMPMPRWRRSRTTSAAWIPRSKNSPRKTSSA